MIEEFGLEFDPCCDLAKIVRGADTARPDLTPQSAGLLAASLGYSRMFATTSPQLDAAMAALRRVLSLVPGRHGGDPQLAHRQTKEHDMNDAAAIRSALANSAQRTA